MMLLEPYPVLEVGLLIEVIRFEDVSLLELIASMTQLIFHELLQLIRHSLQLAYIS